MDIDSNPMLAMIRPDGAVAYAKHINKQDCSWIPIPNIPRVTPSKPSKPIEGSRIQTG
ncbi:hypothetical protein Csa_014357 [Cucumis sativus]|uniref:Uncharacterized protein n=1 Tax=Cucumis sativus TaxID=3659 RepID=A0A0A0LPR6_CUCSA|nr:hypothetical protein Csa_014357 [Cucumis sativus]